MRSVTISASLASGYSLGEALDYLDNLALTSLPPEARVSYAGQSREFRDSSSSLMITFGLALLVVFLVLAAQFESFVHPIIIMLSVPLAITGALATMYFTGITLNVYSQIGLVMLIGLVAKKIGATSQIPFGPFLAAGTLIVYFSGENIINMYITTIMGGY